MRLADGGDHTKDETHRFPVLAEELPANAPQVIPIRTRRKRRIRSAARGALDKLLRYLVRLLPFSLDLLTVIV